MPRWVWILILRQSRPKDGLCQRCAGPRHEAADWRCVECFRDRDMCISCLREAHVNLPFHRVYWWTGRHYRESWLREAGVALYLCPNAPNGTPCPRNPGRFQANIPSRVPAGLRDRRREKGKAPARHAAPAPRAAPAADSAASNTPLPEFISVPRAPPLSSAMDIDQVNALAGWGEAEAQSIPAELPPEPEDIDSELQMLYAAYDAMLEQERAEPEELVGGTDDTTHAPQQPIHASGERASVADVPDAGTVPEPRAHTVIPSHDLHGYAVLTLVHDNGVHGLGVNFCQCPGHLPEHEQLLMHGLFPASTKAPATAFDVGSLEKALVEEAECRTTTESWWKKITRLTVPDDPGATVVCDRTLVYRALTYSYPQNKYNIAIRVRREYRAVREYTEHGFAHQDPAARRAPGPGEMAYRCVACPYHWNVPENWETLTQEERDAHFHCWAIDGNMKADHTVSQVAGNNVQILPGAGFLPDPDDFEAKTRAPLTDKVLPPDIVRPSTLWRHNLTFFPRPRAEISAISTSLPAVSPQRPIRRKTFEVFCQYAARDMAACCRGQQLTSTLPRSNLLAPTSA